MLSMLINKGIYSRGVTTYCLNLTAYRPHLLTASSTQVPLAHGMDRHCTCGSYHAQVGWLSQILESRWLSSMPASAALAPASPEIADTAHASITDTVVALSSGAGRSAVAVIRISGPQADAALQSMLRPGSSLPQPRTAALRSLYDPASRELLDKAVVLRFPGPASFTGEDVVELQGHGGPAVVRALLSVLTSMPDVRLAEAGEFTRRAFMGGKFDLTEVEGIADLLAAETAAQHRQALQQTTGMQRRQYEAWRTTLLHCLAHVEAVIDFGDDNDIDSGVANEVLPGAIALRKELERHLSDGRRGELVRDGVRVALVGPPNAGKSTLLNRLAGRPAAIVSPFPGTTRDAVEVVLELNGQKVIVTDTAGVRETEDVIEAEGVSRARQAASAADIVIAVADVAAPEHDRRLLDWADCLVTEKSGGRAAGAEGQQHFSEDPTDAEHGLLTAEASLHKGGVQHLSAGWTTRPQSQAEASQQDTPEVPHNPAEEEQEQAEKPIILVFNKWDLVSELPFHVHTSASSHDEASQDPDEDAARWLDRRLPDVEATGGRALLPVSRVLGISAETGSGLELLLGLLETEVTRAAGGAGRGHLITQLRHRKHVEECVEALKGYEGVHDQLELASEELRYAARALGKVTGAIDIEHVLDAIFSDFCVGK